MIVFFFTSLSYAKRLTISIDAPVSLYFNPVVNLAVAEAAELLRKSFPSARVFHNNHSSQIKIKLPDVASNRDYCVPGPSVRPYLCTSVPDASYRWVSVNSGGAITLKLEVVSPEGVAAGLYGLLQEKLGFRFYHSRNSIIPTFHAWPLPDQFTFSGTPRFEKRGFHLHSQHPIELTEQLCNPLYPNAFADVKNYIDWLARNGQNTFQFFLLREVDRKTWPEHARRIVDYAHSRGIRCGIQISLSMIQQQAFQAITLLRLYPSYQQQVDDTLAWLFQAPWDYVSLDVTLGEHLPFLDKLFPDVQMHIEQQVEKRYCARLMYATHVIGSNNGGKVRRPKLPNSGIMIHTVMCYSASEAKAPVYGNENQCFMLEAAQVESKRRETWYWPESSYWVGFDSSVPLFLLPYLDARWSDIETMAQIGVSGHLTFTSGWEWGYWLIDWSIARWSWTLKDNGRERTTSPLSRLAELIGDRELQQLMGKALALQNSYLKDRELLRFMSALTPFSELPHPFDKPFQPEPKFRYKWLLNDATPTEAAEAVKQPLADLEMYSERMGELMDHMDKMIERLRSTGHFPETEISILEELERGLRVTALRAGHRALTLRAILATRDEQTGKSDHSRSSELLSRAGLVRQQAQVIVHRQEELYRFPVEQIARRRTSLTAYPFGYLYSASNLCFWEREEEQVRHERFDALFMNLWDMRRTLGLGSLFLK
ncbi:MAG: hypothetical protein PHY09_03155 [Desulfuromonadaceae bacterium]|nr:hypothetical protein [Desulfuromonadaceae bacterium]MDD5104492.1 hypothetical protein [Desulfuromonadaceae bacterium]